MKYLGNVGVHNYNNFNNFRSNGHGNGCQCSSCSSGQNLLGNARYGAANTCSKGRCPGGCSCCG